MKTRTRTGLTLLCLALLSCTPGPQKHSNENVRVENAAFDLTLKQLLSFSVPLAEVKDLKNIQDEVFIFDTRNEEEFVVSHIPGARWLGYEKPRWELLNELPPDAPIVLYCSVGYRSEIMGDRLAKRGFTQVSNLYGGLFAWVNDGQSVVDYQGLITDSVHTYNAPWSAFVDAPGVVKVW